MNPLFFVKKADGVFGDVLAEGVHFFPNYLVKYVPDRFKVFAAV